MKHIQSLLISGMMNIENYSLVLVQCFDFIAPRKNTNQKHG